MNAELLDEILRCQHLPSLPAVALQVIELTGNPNVVMDELATTIQNDQALAAKVLRTVNSSFYGLREPCTTIRKALVMLGLGPVKSLTLGFSLVNSIDMERHPTFPYQEYWRRSLTTAVAAKCFADASKNACPDEAFLAGLLHDLGMIAFSETLGREYHRVVANTNGDHSKLARAELEAFELQHGDVGAMLGERWRLPFDLTGPIKYHERPTAAPIEIADVTRFVNLGNTAHECLTSEDPAPSFRRLFKKLDEWFNIKSDDADEIFQRISAGTKEMSDLFNLDVGDFEKPEDVLAKANRQLIDISKAEPRESYAASQFEGLLSGDSEIDPLLGIPSSTGFDAVLSKAYEHGQSAKEPIAVLQVALEGLADITQAHGIIASDESMIGAVALLHKHVEPMGGVVCRIQPETLGVVLAGADRETSTEVAERFRQDLNSLASEWLPKTSDSVTKAQQVRIAVGLAIADPDTFAFYGAHERMVLAGSKAVQAARKAGGDCLRTFVPKPPKQQQAA